MRALYGLKLHRPDSGRDVVFDSSPVALEGQGLYLARTECIKPFRHPSRYGDLVGGLVGPFVNGGGDLGQLLTDLLLCIAIDTALDLFPCAGVPAHGISSLPPPIWPLPDGAAALGVACGFSWH